MFIAAAFRAKARAALKQHWQTALLIALIVNLPSLLVQGVASSVNGDLIARLEVLMLRASGSAAAANALPDAVRALLAESSVLTMTVLGVLAWLVTPALSTGMSHWTLERLRGQELPVTAVFSRLRIFHKSIGLRLFILLKVFLWMLPGMALTLASVVPLLLTGGTSETAAYFSVFIAYNGMAGMVLLGVVAYLHYAQAEFILADEPEERVLSCARRSKLMMRGRRGRLFSLMFSFIPWYLLVMIVSTFADSVAGSVVALVAEMLGSLILSVYVLASEGAFYEALRMVPPQETPVKSVSAEE